jgi:hypothetical protein
MLRRVVIGRRALVRKAPRPKTTIRG